jgi:hypothetical protein
VAPALCIVASSRSECCPPGSSDLTHSQLESRDDLSGARIVNFVPILVRRFARAELRALTPRKEAS